MNIWFIMIVYGRRISWGISDRNQARMVSRKESKGTDGYMRGKWNQWEINEKDD